MPVYKINLDIISGDTHNTKEIFVEAKNYDHARKISKKLMARELCEPKMDEDGRFWEDDQTRLVKRLGISEVNILYLPSLHGAKKYKLVPMEA